MDTNITLTPEQVESINTKLTEVAAILKAGSAVSDEPVVAPAEPTPAEPTIPATPVTDESEEMVRPTEGAFEYDDLKFFAADTIAAAKTGFKAAYGVDGADTDQVDGVYYTGSESFKAADLPPRDPNAPVPEPVNPVAAAPDGVIAGSANIKKLPGTMSNMENKQGKYGSQNSTHSNRIAIHQRADGQWRQTYAYWGGRDGKLNSQGGGDGRMVVVQRNFPDGNWEKVKDVHEVVSKGGLGDPTWRKGNFDGTQAMEIDNHNNVSCTVTASGRIVVTGNHHAHWVKLAVSDTDNIHGSWSNYDRRDFPTDKINMDRLTYPCLFTLNGAAHIAGRVQRSGGGVQRAPWAWVIYRFEESNNKWVHVSTLGYAAGARQYWTNVAVCTLKNGKQRMTCTGMSRNEVEGGSAAHYDAINVCSDDGGKTWFQHNLKDGGTTPIKLPAIFSIKQNGGQNRYTNVPVKIWDTVGRKDPAVSAHNVEFDANGKPVYFVRANGGKMYVYRHGNNGWTADTGHRITDMARFFNMPNGDLACVYRNGTNIMYMNMNKKSATYGKGKVIVQGMVNGSYGANHDPIAIRQGWVSIPVHKGSVAKPNSGYVASIPIADLDKVSALKA